MSYDRHYNNVWRDNPRKRRPSTRVKGLSTHKPQSHDPFCTRPRINLRNKLPFKLRKRQIDRYMRLGIYYACYFQHAFEHQQTVALLPIRV